MESEVITYIKDTVLMFYLAATLGFLLVTAATQIRSIKRLEDLLDDKDTNPDEDKSPQSS